MPFCIVVPRSRSIRSDIALNPASASETESSEAAKKCSFGKKTRHVRQYAAAMAPALAALPSTVFKLAQPQWRLPA